MENVDEGPILSVDELEMLKDGLTKKLDWFGCIPVSLPYFPNVSGLLISNYIAIDNVTRLRLF